MNARSVTFAKTADVRPGELALFEVAGRRIAVANANGRFFAIDDTCTHEQCSLAEEGTLEGTVVTCGCHGAHVRRDHRGRVGAARSRAGDGLPSAR